MPASWLRFPAFAVLLISTHTCMAIEVDASLEVVDPWKYEFLSRDDLVTQTAGNIRETALDKHLTFDSYWASARKNFEGKTFEALVADVENTANRASRKGPRLVPTAVVGRPLDAADLLIVDSRGNVLGRVQCKLDISDLQAALSMPKYAGMDIVTSKESYDALRSMLFERKLSATQRKVPLPEEWRQIEDAIESNRLWRELPCGAELPTRRLVNETAENLYKCRWTALEKTTRSAGAVLTRSVRNQTDDFVKAGAALDDVASPATVAVDQPLQHLPPTTGLRSPLRPSEGGATSASPRVPAGAGVGSRSAAKKITQKAVAEVSDDLAKATVIQAGGKMLAASVVPVAVAIEVGSKGYESYQTEVRYSRGEISQNIREVEHARNAGGLAGSMGGGVAGGVIGAEVGTAVCPVFGTAVGVVVGAVGGAIAGESAVAAASEAVVGAVHSAGTTVASTATTAADGVRDAWKWATGW